MEEIIRLTNQQKSAARQMWSEIFSEDTPRFTDYYFSHKMKDNEGYGIVEHGRLLAMLFLTPYVAEVRIGAASREGEARFRLVPLSYIVGVGTREECRHRGYMGRLLVKALNDLHKKGQPFGFLMPADPAIYRPYQFSYIYDRPEYKIKAPGVRLCREEIPELAEFAGHLLRERFQLFLHRDTVYYERQEKESRAQNGGIYLWKEGGRIQGFYLYAREDGREEIQEAMLSKEFPDQEVLEPSEKRTPVIMARITNVEAMLSLIRLREAGEKTALLRVRDPLIPDNSGCYLWNLSHDYSNVVDISKKKPGAVSGDFYDSTGRAPEIEVDITTLCDMLFGRTALPLALKGLDTLERICINEIV